MTDTATMPSRDPEAGDLPFRQLAEKLPTPCWISDAEGQVIWVNDAWLAYTGLDVAAIQADGLAGLHDPEILPEVRRRWKAVRLAGEAAEMTFPLRGRDGQMRSFLTRVVPLPDASGKIVRWFGTNTDVSAGSPAAIASQNLILARELSEGAARAELAERRLKRFWEASRDLLAIVSSVDGMPRMINAEAWKATLGYSEEQLMGMRLVDLVHPEDQQRTLNLKPTITENGAVYGFENRYRRADGEWVQLSWNAVREGDLIFSIARDLSEDQRALKALAESEGQFRMLVAGVVDYAIFMLSPEGRVASWNAGAEHIKGYKAEEVIGQHISIFYTEADRAAGTADNALRTAAEQGRYEAEAWRVRKDGAPFFANVVIDAIHDDDGKLVGFAKITRDITERRNAQLELQRAHDRLAQATRMEAMGQLTGGVAHDFNNLLMVVAGQVQLLRKRIAEEPRIVQALDAIDLAARRGQDLTRHLLAFARRQRLRPMAVSLTARAESLIELLGASLGPSVELHVDMSPDLWPVEIDPGELDLALLNMAVNARDAMPGGGRLSVSARNRTVTPNEDSEAAGDYVALTIADTGMGIPEDILERVFEPFFTTKDVNKGTGLGLSQVYGFARQAGGWAAIDSELGKGTRITLFLPRSALAPGDEPPQRSGEMTSSLAVLVVEDNPEVAEVAAGLLELLGHRAELVGNADAALARLVKGPAPDLVFSDIIMAGSMDGLALARAIRERWPGLPILLATGYSQAAERLGGEFPVLAKPYQLADLGRSIAGLFAPA